MSLYNRAAPMPARIVGSTPSSSSSSSLFSFLSSPTALLVTAAAAAAISATVSFYYSNRTHASDPAAATASLTHASPSRTAREQFDHPAQHESDKPRMKLARADVMLRMAQSTQAVLYDLDGTLVESQLIWAALINKAAEIYGYPQVSQESLKQSFGQPMSYNTRMFLPGLDQVEFNTFCDDHYADFLDKLHLLDGSLDLLQFTKQHYNSNLVITTNCPRKIAELILNHLNLNRFFKHVICADDEIDRRLAPLIDRADEVDDESPTIALRAKPFADISLYACHLLHVQPQQAVFVGDSKFDIMCAQAAQNFSIGIGIDTGDITCNTTRAVLEVFRMLQQGAAQTTAHK